MKTKHLFVLACLLLVAGFTGIGGASGFWFGIGIVGFMLVVVALVLWVLGK